jgi:hypothetical protein
MRITVDMLRGRGACKLQVEEFERRFPDGVEVSVAAAVAVANIFDWDWAAENLLPCSAWQAYAAAVEPAWQACDAAVVSAREAYNAGRAEAFARCALEAGEWQ